ncbi:phage head morphogenesis protein [Staphylococcus pseudintermedius]|nr:phage head morphogenesis protein [Staphylococcus pseudintermedius]
MSNLSDYWLERAQQAIQSETLEDAAKVAEIERIVAMMIADIYKNLLAYYAKLATAEGIDWREAKKIVDAFDVEMFQMQAKAYVENKDFSEKANKALKRYNTTMYVNREQLLKHELGLIVTKAYAEQENVINKHLHDSVTRTLEHQSGILGADVHVKPTDVEAIVYSNFGKLNWSERLWNNQDELRKDVERMASHVMLRGRHPYEFVPEIRKKQKQTVANTKRLLITEAARVQTEAQKLHYLETMGDDAEYEFVAKRDEKTSKICRHYDKKVFKVKDMVPGVNAPPMHPHCRSTTVPYVGNWRDDFFKKRKGKYKLDEEETTQLLAKKEMTDAIDSGKIKVELNVEK